MFKCDICGSEVKSQKTLASNKHQNSKKHKEALRSNSLYCKPVTISYSSSIKLLERRVAELEQ